MRRDTLRLAPDSFFIDRIRRTFTAAEADLLTRVHDFARRKTLGVDSTPFQAADLLLEQDADAMAIAGALLTPLLWKKVTNLDEIKNLFGTGIAATIEDADFIALSQSENHHDVRGLLASLGGVPGRALLFIVFRLIALENAINAHLSTGRQMAQETLDLFVPIADRLSLGNLRRRLEDVCFKIIDPADYDHLQKIVAPIQVDDDKCLQILVSGILRLLTNNGIQGRIQARTKSLYGIWRKMKRKGKTLDEVMDRIGLRIIVTSVLDCYTVLGLLHAHFKPIPDTFNDYIGLPKDNGYQSLHTCVYPVRELSHKPIEFQVRTELMHMEAEHGVAAHWRYKGASASMKRARQQAQWMEGLSRQHKKAESTEAFIELLYQQVFQDSLVVFGNGGRIVRLAAKATVQDYLNITNMKVPGDAAVKVNGKPVDMDQSLRDGDSIEVVVNGGQRDNGHGIDWILEHASQDMRERQSHVDGPNC